MRDAAFSGAISLVKSTCCEPGALIDLPPVPVLESRTQVHPFINAYKPISHYKPILDLPLVHKKVHHFFSARFNVLLRSNACLQKEVLDVVGASHLQCAPQHTAHARLSNIGIFFSKNTGGKGAPFYFASFRARFAPPFRDRRMLSSPSCPACMNSSKTQESAKTCKSMTPKKKSARLCSAKVLALVSQFRASKPR